MQYPLGSQWSTMLLGDLVPAPGSDHVKGYLARIHDMIHQDKACQGGAAKHGVAPSLGFWCQNTYWPMMRGQPIKLLSVAFSTLALGLLRPGKISPTLTDR
jgi:hypothetical protein